MGHSSLPTDYEAFKAGVLEDARDEGMGVQDVWYAANGRYPSASLSQRLAIAEHVVSELLAEHRVRLCRGTTSGPDQSASAEPDPSDLLLAWSTWFPQDDEIYWLEPVDERTYGGPRNHGPE